MRLIQTVDAEGTVLYHDITQIIKEVTRDAVFRKSHVVMKGGIPVLLSVGKDQLYAWEREDGALYENDATEILRDMCRGQHMEYFQAKEEEIELTAVCDGLLKVGNRGLRAVSGFGQVMIATRHGSFAVKRGGKLVGTRIIPLVIGGEKMEAVERAAAEATGGCPTLKLKPSLHKKMGIITTGNEVFCGCIGDTFAPVIRGKPSEFDTEVIDHVTWNDDDTKVTTSILDMIQKGADVVVCTRGMGVNPDDKTPLVIRSIGADIVSYGAPVLLGAMLLPAYYQAKGGGNSHTVAIVELPGCAMYARRTIFDLVLSRIMADDQATADDLVVLDQGGSCLSCPECTFSNCGFGRGM